MFDPKKLREALASELATNRALPEKGLSAAVRSNDLVDVSLFWPSSSAQLRRLLSRLGKCMKRWGFAECSIGYTDTTIAVCFERRGSGAYRESLEESGYEVRPKLRDEPPTDSRVPTNTELAAAIFESYMDGAREECAQLTFEVATVFAARNDLVAVEESLSSPESDFNWEQPWDSPDIRVRLWRLAEHIAENLELRLKFPSAADLTMLSTLHHMAQPLALANPLYPLVEVWMKDPLTS